ncbi:MAG: hypothetical protein M1492_08560 [Gammaproteobacteria bacterium]|jgi:hypothetical protein|nr:hypothetical protein [Gammaproteobacteria bacterium]
MHFTEKKGQRLAVFDHLVSPETGQHIETPVTSPAMEASMLQAEALGGRGVESILDPRDPAAAQFHPDNETISTKG